MSAIFHMNLIKAEEQIYLAYQGNGRSTNEAREKTMLVLKVVSLGHELQPNREDGLAFCTRCHGGEIELDESCASRLKKQADKVLQERNDSDEYIRAIWRKDQLPSPMSDRLFDRLTSS